MSLHQTTYVLGSVREQGCLPGGRLLLDKFVTLTEISRPGFHFLVREMDY